MAVTLRTYVHGPKARVEDFKADSYEKRCLMLAMSIDRCRKIRKPLVLSLVAACIWKLTFILILWSIMTHFQARTRKAQKSWMTLGLAEETMFTDV